jgi:N-acetylglucosamine-6-phosphate deacetylase
LSVEGAVVGGELMSGDVEVEDGRVVAVGLGGGRGVVVPLGHSAADAATADAAFNRGARTVRIAVVSDAVAAAGLGMGVSRPPEGTLAGGTGTVPDAVRRLVGLGVPFAEAVDAATRVPARILGRADIGTLGPGARADVAVLDDELRVTRVLRAGIG